MSQRNCGRRRRKRVTGVEPATLCLASTRSSQLSYTRVEHDNQRLNLPHLSRESTARKRTVVGQFELPLLTSENHMDVNPSSGSLAPSSGRIISSLQGRFSTPQQPLVNPQGKRPQEGKKAGLSKKLLYPSKLISKATKLGIKVTMSRLRRKAKKKR